MYSPRAIFTQQPVAIAGALRSVLFVLILAGLVVMDEKLLSAIALSAEVLLNLFVWNAVKPVASARVDEAQAYADGVKEGESNA